MFVGLLNSGSSRAPSTSSAPQVSPISSFLRDPREPDDGSSQAPAATGRTPGELP